MTEHFWPLGWGGGGGATRKREKGEGTGEIKATLLFPLRVLYCPSLPSPPTSPRVWYPREQKQYD